ncbi:hypothetical protein HNY73_003512 [Argiope bruennichi]|uniref:Uncharacterized protein n=1 Tax=Argiope bruennichi TaxID=94029 RepID=A0A8T0FLF2_ARGBR|nr:hypothetical protein HNY73_003512 [Argiope bruennichi]
MESLESTRQIIRERPRDLLKERLSDTRHRCYPDRRRGRGRVQTDYGDHDSMPDYSHDHQKHDRGDMPHIHYPAFMTEPCQPGIHQGQPSYDRQGYDPDARMRMRPKMVPFRHCCVTPKYTGHIPGMQFVFGESLPALLTTL